MHEGQEDVFVGGVQGHSRRRCKVDRELVCEGSLFIDVLSRYKYTGLK